jgi:hypothetical protein
LALCPEELESTLPALFTPVDDERTTPPLDLASTYRDDPFEF